MIKAGILSVLMATANPPTADATTINPYDYGHDNRLFLADIGDHFEYLNPSFPNNKIIRDIDDNIVTMLEGLFNAEVASDPKNYLTSPLMNNYYGPYNEGLANIIGTRNFWDIPQLNEALEFCVSVEVENYYQMFLSQLKQFAEETYNLNDEFIKMFESTEGLIKELGSINNELSKEQQKSCDLLVAGAVRKNEYTI